MVWTVMVKTCTPIFKMDWMEMQGWMRVERFTGFSWVEMPQISLACPLTPSLPRSIPAALPPPSNCLSFSLPPLSVDLHQVLSDSFGKSSSLLTTHANQIPFKQISN